MTYSFHSSNTMNTFITDIGEHSSSSASSNINSDRKEKASDILSTIRKATINKGNKEEKQNQPHTKIEVSDFLEALSGLFSSEDGHHANIDKYQTINLKQALSQQSKDKYCYNEPFHHINHGNKQNTINLVPVQEDLDEQKHIAKKVEEKEVRSSSTFQSSSKSLHGILQKDDECYHKACIYKSVDKGPK